MWLITCFVHRFTRQQMPGPLLPFAASDAFVHVGAQVIFLDPGFGSFGYMTQNWII